MFGIGFPELIIIMVIALIVIGPSKLPEIAKALGKGLAEFRKASQEIKDSLNFDEDIQDMKDDIIDSVSDINKGIHLEDEGGGEDDDYSEKAYGDSPEKDENEPSIEKEKDTTESFPETDKDKNVDE